MVRTGLVCVLFAACGGGGGAGGGVDGGSSHDAAADGGPGQIDGGGGGGDTRLLPLAEGAAWTYDVTLMGAFPVCSGGQQVEEVLGEVTIDGRAAFEVRSFCPAAGTNSLA